VDAAGGGLQFTGNQLDDGGLTGAGRTDQEAKLAILNLHIDTVQGLIALVIGFYYVDKLYHKHLSPVIESSGNPENPAM
jgi:hypothetical protein